MKQAEVYTYMMHKLSSKFETHETVVLTIDKADKAQLKWRNDHEITYKGKFYDVINFETTESGALKIRCYQDEKEESVALALEESVKANHDTKSNHGKSDLAKTLIKDYYPTSDNFISHSSSILVLFSLISDRVLYRPSQISTPPPQYISSIV